MKPQNLVLFLALSACAPSATNTASVRATTGEDTSWRGDQSCLKQASTADQVDALEAIALTGSSYREMIVCGGLSVQLSRDVQSIVITNLLDVNGIEMTTGFVYDGDGQYVSASGTTDMVVTYLYGDDLQAGAEDEVVRHNLFDFANYLRGASPGFDLQTGDLLVHWDSTGPLVELLGRGANPPNPMRFGIDSLDAPHKLGRLKMVSSIAVVDSEETATVTYTLTSEPKRINPLLDQGTLEFDSLTTETVTARGAILNTTSWGVEYQDDAGDLEGDVDFELKSGTLTLEGMYTFDGKTDPESEWSCVPDPI